MHVKKNYDQSFGIIHNILDAITHQSEKCFFETYIKGHVKQVIIDIMVPLFSFLHIANALAASIRTVSSKLIAPIDCFSEMFLHPLVAEHQVPYTWFLPRPAGRNQIH